MCRRAGAFQWRPVGAPRGGGEVDYGAVEGVEAKGEAYRDTLEDRPVTD